MHRDTHRAFSRLEEEDQVASAVRVIEQPPMRATGMICGGSAVIVIEVKGHVLADDGGRAKLDVATKMAAEVFGMTHIERRSIERKDLS